MASIMLRYVPSIPTLVRVFNHKWMSNAFSASIEMTMWFLAFHLLMWCMMLLILLVLNHPCEPGMNTTWSGINLFDMLLYLVG